MILPTTAELEAAEEEALKTLRNRLNSALQTH